MLEPDAPRLYPLDRQHFPPEISIGCDRLEHFVQPHLVEQVVQPVSPPELLFHCRNVPGPAFPELLKNARLLDSPCLLPPPVRPSRSSRRCHASWCCLSTHLSFRSKDHPLQDRQPLERIGLHSGDQDMVPDDIATIPSTHARPCTCPRRRAKESVNSSTWDNNLEAGRRGHENQSLRHDQPTFVDWR